MTDPSDYLDTEGASSFLNIPADTLISWRSRGKGPPFLKVEGSLVRYERPALIAWMTSQTSEGPSSNGL